MAMPPLHALQAFEAVGRCGTMSTAAKELGVTPSAISQQVRKLEDHLGVTLLERIGRRVELTSWGVLLHKEVTKGFSQLNHSVGVLERARSQTGIVLTALSSIVNKWIGRKIFEWQALYPDANVRIIGKDDEPSLSDGQSDFRITYGKCAEVHTHFAPLYTDWVVPACSPRLLGGRTLSAPAGLLKFPLLNIEWESHYSRPPQWNEWAQRVGATVNEKLSSLFFALSSNAIDAAVNGHGFVLAQLSMIEDEVRAGTLVVPFDIRLQLPESYYLAWDRSVFEKPYGREFHMWMMGIAKKQSIASSPNRRV
ncbi:LysR family transcriptional regulator [Rhizobium brockwellii]|uniref:LysR family transcriptional regulator n=1 Tax=Rhizobium brockwellii TaxID=3019932 RepID=A0ABU3YVX0_9HYPH|nr:LysR family transcriptional regulator [Rhizobium brockwellii]MDV4183129.1 LysR family transcriptional regulator [Rhizobium brockwellii]MDV4189988.1 LysR family transcriptional regulator [Rhizobium brockwellii]